MKTKEVKGKLSGKSGKGAAKIALKGKSEKVRKTAHDLADKCFTEEQLPVIFKKIDVIEKEALKAMAEIEESGYADGEEEYKRSINTINLIFTIINHMKETAHAQREDTVGLYSEIVGYLTGVFILNPSLFRTIGVSLKEALLTIPPVSIQTR